MARHWPTPETNLSIDTDTAAAVKNIVSIVKSTITALALNYPLCFTITAGRDSRAVLACARDYVAASSFITFAANRDSPDMQIPALIAARLQLNHRFIPTIEANTDALAQWLYVTGWCVSGRIWTIHKTLEQLDPKQVLLPGTSAEVHKGVYHRPKDEPGTKITAPEVLTRCKLPHHPAFIEATEAWLQELQFLDAYRVMDLVHLEQRLGSWAAPQHYGNITSAFEMAVYNSRPVFHAMMRLPEPYRQKRQLAIAICEEVWPQLLQFPFNEFTGVKGFFFSRAKKMRTRIKEMMGRN